MGLVGLACVLGFFAVLATMAEPVSDVSTSPQPGTTAPSVEPGAKELIEALKSVREVAPPAWYIVALRLGLAGILGLILSLVYRATYTGKKKRYDPSMMQSQLLLCIGGALVWIIVAGKIVRAFGLAGALALIRYRTPVRDPKDTVVVFLSMLVGMACGLDMIPVAFTATAFISLALFGIYQFRLGKKKKKKKKPQGDETTPAATGQD